MSIGDEGWSRSKVQDHVRVLNKIDGGILDSARACQDGRPSQDDAAPSFDFSENWFRTIGKDGSSLYALSDASYFQQWFMAWFVHEERCDVGKQKIGRKIDELVATGCKPRRVL